MNRLIHIVSILTFITLQAIAQTVYAADTSWYQIEVLVFSQQDLYREEKHRMDVQLSYPDNWRNLYDPSSPQNRIVNSASSETDSLLNPSTATNSLSGADKESYVALPQNLLKLGPDNYTLKRAPGYRPLYHKAWRQQGLSLQHSPWLVIQGGKSYGDHYELEGSFRLVKSRHLHIQANLWKTRFASLAPSLAMETVQTDSSTPEIHSPEHASPVSTWPTLPDHPGTETSDNHDQLTLSKSKYQVTDIIKLEQSVRVSGGELTYLDHPEMGVLVLVNAYVK